jgi:hypothetical protein
MKDLRLDFFPFQLRAVGCRRAAFSKREAMGTRAVGPKKHLWFPGRTPCAGFQHRRDRLSSGATGVIFQGIEDLL